jgi:hypothetical protein
MSTEIEAGGALVEAGLVAHELEGTKPAGAHAAHGACLNCGTPLQDRFCAHCGQGAHLHRSLLHLVEELLHGLFHFDAKGWRTLPLLVARPGLLTRRYIDGQRMRYVSPLALFLFTVFLMFFAASMTASPADVVIANDFAGAKAEVEHGVDKARAMVAKQQANIERIRRRGGNAGDVRDAEEELADARAELADAESAVNAVALAASAAAAKADPATAAKIAAQMADGAAASAATPAGPAASAADAEATGSEHAPGWAQALRRMKTGHPRLDAAVKHAADNPELTIYKLKNTAYKFSFALVPISLPFLWLMFFWRRGIAMYDHAVFVLYSLSFMSLLLVALMALGAAHAGRSVALLASIAPPLHMAAQLKETYRLGVWSTLWRTVALLVVSAIVFTLFLLLIVYVTMG